jgi:hypothetical protein
MGHHIVGTDEPQLRSTQASFKKHVCLDIWYRQPTCVIFENGEYRKGTIFFVNVPLKHIGIFNF